MRKVMLVFGTRPESIKLAPVIHEMQADQRFEPIVVVTAQHRSMLDQVLELFSIQPHHDLDLMLDRQNVSTLTARAIERLEKVMQKESPDMVVVQGDTTSTMTGALVGFYHQIPVAHVEAGLRTGDRYSPFPEEVNRRVVAQMASLNLAATETAKDNLLAEGHPESSVVVTGNTGIDALHRALRLTIPEDPVLAKLFQDPRRVLLVTAHRRESWGLGMERISAALAQLAHRFQDLLIVLPLHGNPGVRESILPQLAGLDNVVTIEPLDYGGMVRLLDRSYVILTDSGGIQEEAPSLGKPVLVMRDTTERPEGLAAGTARLVGTDPARIVSAVSDLLEDDRAYAAMARAINPYGDGRAAGRVVAAIANFFGYGQPPTEFRPFI